jgi:sulfhydrogenase subunit delta
MPADSRRPRLAVWKFASCDGCQLTVLDCQDELLALAGEVDIAHFAEATSAELPGPGPFDVSLVEGSVSTPDDAVRIRQVRANSRILVTIGACATAGGIQALRNFGDVAEFAATVYARPDYISTLATSTPISSHVPVDFELPGCPIDKRQLIGLLTALLAGREPRIPGHSVCEQCKLRGVRHGGTRHPVPGSCDASWLRSDLPGVRPGLLRLLRPDGHAQRRLAHRMAAPPGHARLRHQPRIPHLPRRHCRIPGSSRADRARTAGRRVSWLTR